MGTEIRRWTVEEFFDGARPPTEDDAPIAAHGRVLGTADKLIAYLNEINELRINHSTSA